MKITVIGTGYVGLVTGTCFAEMGNDVTCVDKIESKIESLKQGIIPIYEPGLEDMVQRNIRKGALRFTTDTKQAVINRELCFIAVGTPMGEDGSADLQHVLMAAKEIGQFVKNKMIIVEKSTVPVGTADKVRETIAAELKKRNCTIEFDVVSNPEFLKEGTACEDFMRPDRIIVGADNVDSLEVMQELYRPFILSEEAFIAMDTKSAELTKYAANSILATKISFINEMSQLCELVGADINKVRKGIGSDKRIGYKFIHPGCGYGGSCFPKDLKALIKTGADFGYRTEILCAVENVNAKQKMVLINKIRKVFGDDLKNLTFAIWGLSFKPETNDMRESPSITIIKELVARGATVQAYDPQAAKEAKEGYLRDLEGITYASNKYDALNDADALLLITEWTEFRSPDFPEMAKRLRGKYIFDGRNQYNAKSMKKSGFHYEQIGVKTL